MYITYLLLDNSHTYFPDTGTIIRRKEPHRSDINFSKSDSVWIVPGTVDPRD